MTRDYLEDQKIGCNGFSATRTVTGYDVLAFGGITGDLSELHTGRVVAEASEFGDRIGHGMLNLSLMHGLVIRQGRLATTGPALPRTGRQNGLSRMPPSTWIVWPVE
ncbi:MaoC/PaaZ C-terminal domain-containing protein [Paracoccus sp. (in: a-proteobacteria)]|uniref:MaoC/PaaZ C-terminal domain-containing protein n=1 Tax=Paracoccus sp. TaxID=267 RepID=UPI003A882581